MKKIIYLAILVIACGISYYMGSHDVYMAKDVNKNGTETVWYPHAYSIRNSLEFEWQYSNALFEGLHFFYQEYPEVWNEFKTSKEHAKIDSLNGCDWEDFYTYWK